VTLLQLKPFVTALLRAFYDVSILEITE
jgi:hypothetical protein